MVTPLGGVSRWERAWLGLFFTTFILGFRLIISFSILQYYYSKLSFFLLTIAISTSATQVPRIGWVSNSPYPFKSSSFSQMWFFTFTS